MDSGPHHHGEAETAGYVLSGTSRVYWGENYQEYVELEAGDMVYIPPYLPHVERNMSDTEPVEFVTARSPANIVVNLDEDVDI
ncbi:MAG: cupin domain-containing protein [Salinirussus sp.]